MRKVTIFCHRWLGLFFCLLFAWWFVSGIFMMYAKFPGVSSAERIDRAQPVDSTVVRLFPVEAISRLLPGTSVSRADLEMLDGRPVYRFGNNRDSFLVYADDGSIPQLNSRRLLLGVAASWARRPANSGRILEVTAPDQWTIEFGRRMPQPLWKCIFSDGQEVYVSGRTGEVVQYTTFSSRALAYFGPIAHWLYFTPLRIHQKLWSNIVIWLSGVATFVPLLGLIAGLSMYSPAMRYRIDGVPTGNPYRGPKRFHMTLGLCFGTIVCAWSFSGMLSMDPFPIAAQQESELFARVRSALRPAKFRVEDYAKKSPQDAMQQLNGIPVKRLDLASSGGEPFYLATLNGREKRIVPVSGEPVSALDRDKILTLITSAVHPVALAGATMLTSYDTWYLDRTHEKPLPVLLVRFRDPLKSQVYVDPASGQLVGSHSETYSQVQRWLYHGLHSMNFPWLYNHRPLWDVVVLSLMLGGLAVSVTSIIIAVQLLRRVWLGKSRTIRS